MHFSSSGGPTMDCHSTRSRHNTHKLFLLLTVLVSNNYNHLLPDWKPCLVVSHSFIHNFLCVLIFIDKMWLLLSESITGVCMCSTFAVCHYKTFPHVMGENSPIRLKRNFYTTYTVVGNSSMTFTK